MQQQTLRKYAMGRISSLQYEIQVLNELVKSVDKEDEAGTTSDTPTPAASQKPASKPVEAKTTATAKPAAKAAPKTAAPVEEADDDLFGDDSDSTEIGATLDDVRKTLKEFAAKHGKDKALKILSKFKVQAIPDIKEVDYAKVIELCQKHM